MTIHYEEKIDLFEAFAVSGQTITFYNENEPIEQYAQKKAAFMKVWEKLKRLADAALVELWVDEHGHHKATFLGRVCFARCQPGNEDGSEGATSHCHYPDCAYRS
jgi:hypothetical protein